MSDGRRLERFVRTKLRRAGAQYEGLRRSTGEQLEEARTAYEGAKHARSLPTDEAGRAKIVCRRYAEQRAAKLDDEFRPACYEHGHPDCEGCIEDVRSGRIETW
ncbi:hypothetical protein EL22_26560 [Halostagnicola sp. A56]|uniref:DUF7091 family protein n=1 Tax=Halostagnicola sp. A56 TaxID=1495067 RepID=UPI00065F6A2A|nr:hypothetical protein [Halostagnicola sp. A56]KMT45871.1 hypothetical protein EL22_26560 [Halostagnicola sp. A56]